MNKHFILILLLLFPSFVIATPTDNDDSFPGQLLYGFYIDVNFDSVREDISCIVGPDYIGTIYQDTDVFEYNYYLSPVNKSLNSYSSNQTFYSDSLYYSMSQHTLSSSSVRGNGQRLGLLPESNMSFYNTPFPHLMDQYLLSLDTCANVSLNETIRTVNLELKLNFKVIADIVNNIASHSLWSDEVMTSEDLLHIINDVYPYSFLGMQFNFGQKTFWIQNAIISFILENLGVPEGDYSGTTVSVNFDLSHFFIGSTLADINEFSVAGFYNPRYPFVEPDINLFSEYGLTLILTFFIILVLIAHRAWKKSVAISISDYSRNYNYSSCIGCGFTNDPDVIYCMDCGLKQ